MCLVGRYYLTDREKSPTFFLLGRAKKLPWTPRVFSISSASRPVMSLWNHLQIYTGIETKKYCMKTASITHIYFKQTNRNTRLHTPRGCISFRQVVFKYKVRRKFCTCTQQRNDDKQIDKILPVNCRLNTNYIIFPFVAKNRRFCDDPDIIFDLFLFNSSSSMPILKYLTKT